MSQSIRNSVFKITTICVSSIALFIGTASADPLTESFSVSGYIQDAPSSGQFTLPDFNPTLGTLEGVHITLDLYSCALIEVYNSTTSPVDFTNASLTVSGSLLAPGGLQFKPSLTPVFSSGVALPGINSYKTAIVYDDGGQNVGSSALSLYEGQPGGVVDFSFVKNSLTYQGTAPGSNNLFFGGLESGYGTLKVIYTYLNSSNTGAVPEPSGKLLSFIAAGAMLALVAGRRTSRRV